MIIYECKEGGGKMKLKRISSILLAIVMLFSCMSLSAFATNGANVDTRSYAKDPYTDIKSSVYTKVISTSNISRGKKIVVRLLDDGNASQNYAVKYRITEHMFAKPDIETEFTLKLNEEKEHYLNTVGNNFTIEAKYEKAGIEGTIQTSVCMYS